MHRAPWPTAAGHQGAPALMSDASVVLTAVRKAKSEAKVGMRAPVEIAVVSGPEDAIERLSACAADLRAVGSIDDLQFQASGDSLSVSVTLAPTNA